MAMEKEAAAAATEDLVPAALAAEDVLRDTDLTVAEVRAVIRLARQVKSSPGDYASTLRGRYLALLFEKPSLRTRMTFELAIKQLGGDAVFQDHRDGRIGEREPAKDMARNLERWVDAIVARTFDQATLEDLARWSSVPVINALSGSYHPCQALADLQTLDEHFGSLRGLKLTFVGDGNNVCHSLMLNASRLGVAMTVACPQGYEPDEAIFAEARGYATASGTAIEIVNDAVEGVRGASAVYADLWTSMGWESETQQRRIAFSAFQVTEDLMAAAGPDAVFMHCLPASRGEEVTDAVMESPASRVFDQAENRLHAQKALLLMLLHSRSRR